MQIGDFLKFPETGDRGTVFCPAISENFETLDIHNHNGVNSPLIVSSAISKTEINLLIAGWSLHSSGDYRQLVTLTGDYTFDNSVIKCVIASGSNLGREINPTIEKVTSTTFYVYVYTNTYDLDVVVC